MGLVLHGDAQILAATRRSAADLDILTWSGFLLDNLVVGSALMAGLLSWFVYLRQPTRGSPSPTKDL